jgi:hypothetical protein
MRSTTAQRESDPDSPQSPALIDIDAVIGSERIQDPRGDKEERRIAVVERMTRLKPVIEGSLGHFLSELSVVQDVSTDFRICSPELCGSMPMLTNGKGRDV